MDKKSEKQDQRILLSFADNPQKGFRLMFDTYYTDLCLYALQITDSFYLSEDIVQEFFVLFWEKKYYKSIRQNLRHYLFYSVRNSAITALRKDNRIPLDTILNEAEFSEDISLDDDKEKQINKAFETIKKLPIQEQKVIKRIFFKRQKYKETAQELHISVNTVKTYLARAMKHLREACIFFLLSILFAAITIVAS